MLNTKTIPKLRASDGGFGLRVRAVLFEGDKESAKERRFKAKPRNFADVDPSQLLAFPLVRDYLAEHSGFLPAVRTGSPTQAKATRQRLEVMRRNAGPLVLLTVAHPELNQPLKSCATAEAWGIALTDLLDQVAPACPAYTAALQGGVLRKLLRNAK